MKTKNLIVEIICLILVLNFFYEGVYKIAYFSNYGFWLYHAPLLRPVAGILTYVIPTIEIGLSLALLTPSYRVATLYSIIGVLIVFVLWVMSVCLFTHRLFWPYHALWQKTTWMQKMLISMGLCWLAFVAVVISKGGFSLKRFSSNSLRNTHTPANVT